MSFFSKLLRFNDWGLLVLRLAIGVIFIQHGLYKWMLWHMQPSDQLPVSMLMILRFLSIAEPLGGAAMIIGILTPITSIAMSILMVLVINMKITVQHIGFIGDKATGWEFDFVILAGALCILLVGPGKISLQRFFSKGPANG